MRKIIWDIEFFNIYLTSKYKNIYSVEEDLNSLYGSSNFSGIDSCDWFLINKENKLEFMLLSVPSVISVVNDSVFIDKFQELSYIDSVKIFFSDVSIQDSTIISLYSNEMVVSSDISHAVHKVLISDDLYFLLGQDLKYKGFVLVNFSKHVMGYKEGSGEEIFLNSLSMMSELCTEEAYNAMEERSEYYLLKIHRMEKYMMMNQRKDERLIQIMNFIKNIKDVFYNMPS